MTTTAAETTRDSASRYHLDARFARLVVIYDDLDDARADTRPDDDRIAVVVHDDELRACCPHGP